MKTPIEQRIREKLDERKLSIIDLARKIGVSRGSLYHIFKGNFSREMLEKLAKELSIPPHTLISPIDSPASLLADAYQKAPESIQKTVDLLLGLNPDQKLSHRARVIVVDDVEENVQLLQRSLRNDFEVLAFTDPHEALRAIHEMEVNAIVTDQRMPGMTGSELLETVERMKKNIRKLVVSAYSDNEALIDMINKSKADAFFLKPFKLHDLRNRLCELLN